MLAWDTCTSFKHHRLAIIYSVLIVAIIIVVVVVVVAEEVVATPLTDDTEIAPDLFSIEETTVAVLDGEAHELKRPAFAMANLDGDDECYATPDHLKVRMEEECGMAILSCHDVTRNITVPLKQPHTNGGNIDNAPAPAYKIDYSTGYSLFPLTVLKLYARQLVRMGTNTATRQLATTV